MFLAVIFFSFVRQECEKRLPAKFNSISVVFLFNASSMIDSICSLKKLSVSFTEDICLSTCNASIRWQRPASFSLHEEKSNFFSLV